MLGSTAVSEPAPASIPETPPLVVQGLCCVRGDRELFAELDLAIAPGEVLQIEGDNGTGKTTLLRAVCGLAPIEEGRVLWHGLDVMEAADEFLGALTYIGHTAGVKRDLTPIENLDTAIALTRAAPAVDPESALARLGLLALEHTPLRQLSAGQGRRVALARLLVIPTTLWVLDEPFTALDATGKSLVETMITEHCANGGLVLVSTHQPLALDGVRVHHLRLGA